MRKKPCDDLTGYKWFHVGIVHCIRYFPYTRRYFTGYFAQHCFRISGAGNNRIESFFIPASTSHKRKTEEILSGRYVFTYSLQIIIPYILKEKNMGLPRRFFQDRQDFFGMEIICRNDDILKIIVGRKNIQDLWTENGLRFHLSSIPVIRTMDMNTLFFNRLLFSLSNQKTDVVPGLGQLPAIGAANHARAKNKNLHNKIYLLFAIREEDR